jgi:hypothetical protein
MVSAKGEGMGERQQNMQRLKFKDASKIMQKYFNYVLGKIVKTFLNYKSAYFYNNPQQNIQKHAHTVRIRKCFVSVGNKAFFNL